MKHPQMPPEYIDYRRGDPRAAFAQWSSTAGEGRLLVVDFDFTPWWLPGSPDQQLTAIYLLRRGAAVCAVTDKTLEVTAASALEQYADWERRYELFTVQLGATLPLQPTYIPKPWGQEIWFTGIEERGVCRFGSGQASAPIPWLQAALPDESYGPAGEPLVLLKILDPAAAEVTGDLYFEMHEEKREVYVVTHIDRNAWPDGTGAIRYGFAPEKLAAYASEAEFREHYLAAVEAYETVRRQIDAGDDRHDLAEREQMLRREMDSFTHLRPLVTGDVVVVPLRMPHSLQHGVRTIEFQTPVYERKILSFAQRVLTQDHWDTAEALPDMRLLPPPEQVFELLEHAEGVYIERIVDFEDFEVRRIRIDAACSFALEPADSYSLVMVVEGEALSSGVTFTAEQAFIVPAGTGVERQSGPLVMLQALPRS